MALTVFVLIVATVVCVHAEDAETKKALMKPIEGKWAGGGYGYKSQGGYGHNQGGYGHDQGGYGQGHHRGGVGHGQHSQHHQQHRQEEKHVAIKIPFIDRSGCRFPGDVVCNDPADPLTYFICLLANENKNLWKKPTFATIATAVDCPDGSQVSSQFCNNNLRLLRAAGLLQEKDKHQKRFHQSANYFVTLNPCIVAV